MISMMLKIFVFIYCLATLAQIITNIKALKSEHHSAIKPIPIPSSIKGVTKNMKNKIALGLERLRSNPCINPS